MNSFLLIAVLVLNVLISVWNCYAVGTAWKDTMALGGRFEKALLWSGIIQSGVGFSMPILLALSFGTLPFLTAGEHPVLTSAEANQFVQDIFSLWYLAIIFPILGSGLAIWAHSVRIAFQRRDFSSIAVAGWNSSAQIVNTLSAVHNVGFAWENVVELFGEALSGKGDGKGKVAILVVLLVVVSLVAGFLIAFSLVRYFNMHTASRMEDYARSLYKQGS